MSTPPGMTTRPVASSVLSGRALGSDGASMIWPSLIQMSRSSPLTPFVGS